MQLRFSSPCYSGSFDSAYWQSERSYITDVGTPHTGSSGFWFHGKDEKVDA
jgi:hypothetical protein